MERTRLYTIATPCSGLTYPLSRIYARFSQCISSLKYVQDLHQLLDLPDQRCGIIAAQRDVAMMVAMAATERTERQRHGVVDSAGLKVDKMWTDVVGADDVMELGPGLKTHDDVPSQ